MHCIFFLYFVISYIYALSATSKFGIYYTRMSPRKTPFWQTIAASKNNHKLPLLHLPYSTYRATQYDPIDDIYIFGNIRYAAPPTGKNRFSLPQRPLKYDKIQDGTTGHSCYQSTPTQFLIARPALEGITQSEDCLFLDLFVPGHVVRSLDVKSKKLAIVHWIFGGGFGMLMSHLNWRVVMGMKELYGGSIFLRESNNTLIFVRSNYRVSYQQLVFLNLIL